ncbi:glycoside hydrolase family 47 protein, partial [Mycena alexandri]
ADIRKRDAVVKAFQHAWSAYEQDAFGADEYHPISHRGSNLTTSTSPSGVRTSRGIGYTIIDALDTMLLMGEPLAPQYEKAKAWVKRELPRGWMRVGSVSTFETTIRTLGGLLSAYHLSQDPMFLERAAELGARLLPAFGEGLWAPAQKPNRRMRTDTSIAEAATLQLEFRYLAHALREWNDKEFWYKAEHVMRVLNQERLESGLAPHKLNTTDGSFLWSSVRMGSSGDSYFEYLLKQYIQTNRTESVYLQMYTDAMRGVQEHMVQRSPWKGHTYITELVPVPGRDDWTGAKQDHLACFLAGSLMLGATRNLQHLRASVPPQQTELTAEGRRDWKVGLALLEGCMDTTKTLTGLAPESVWWRADDQQALPDEPGQQWDWYIMGASKFWPPYDARYILRPEIAESVFLAWRLTGARRYRTYAWNIFTAIEMYCRLPEGGYATVMDVDNLPVKYEDKQETFFLSETLKYLYLTFADENVLDLNEVVFNTEAHPLPIFTPTIKPRFTEYSTLKPAPGT